MSLCNVILPLMAHRARVTVTFRQPSHVSPCVPTCTVMPVSDIFVTVSTLYDYHVFLSYFYVNLNLFLTFFTMTVVCSDLLFF
jgi:hypothetical protein